MVVHGHSSERCTVVVAHERTGHLAIYPHGWDKFAVRLSHPEALTMARAIIAAHR